MKKGFTLLEITIVVSIIILMGTIFVINFRGGEKQFALQRSAHKLAQDLRRAQETAMSSQIFEDSFPKGGYGIYLEKGSNSYILFADCDGNQTYSEAGFAQSCAEAGTNDPFREKIEEISFEKGIYISEFSPEENSVAITFFPPDPKITINPSNSSILINLTFDGKIKRAVSINSVGLIDVD
jgi:type II secretory pathway pseudopilin PulG